MIFFSLNKKCSSWIRGLSQVWRTLLMRFQFFCSNHTRRKIPQRKPCSKTRWGAKPDTTDKDKKCTVWRSLRSAGGDVPWQETLFSSPPGNGNGMGDSTLSSEPLPFWGQGDKKHGLLFSKNQKGYARNGSWPYRFWVGQSPSAWAASRPFPGSSMFRPVPACFLYSVLLFHFCFSCWFVCCSQPLPYILGSSCACVFLMCLNHRKLASFSVTLDQPPTHWMGVVLPTRTSSQSFHVPYPRLRGEVEAFTFSFPLPGCD